MKTFKIVSLNISEKKGIVKTPVGKMVLKEKHGIIGDAHAGKWHRQVSLLANEDVEYMKLKLDTIVPGDFAENITTEGVELNKLPVGTTIKIGESVLEVTQIGKKCHKDCEVMQKVGECIMPSKGIFAKVIKGGEITNESIGSYSI